MPYCSSCGNDIPEGQGHSCSMCYGDPYYGKDGYYLDWLEQQYQKEAAEKAREEAQWIEAMENDRRNRAESEYIEHMIGRGFEEYIDGLLAEQAAQEQAAYEEQRKCEEEWEQQQEDRRWVERWQEEQRQSGQDH